MIGVSSAHVPDKFGRCAPAAGSARAGAARTRIPAGINIFADFNDEDACGEGHTSSLGAGLCQLVRGMMDGSLAQSPLTTRRIIWLAIWPKDPYTGPAPGEWSACTRLLLEKK